MNATLLFVFLLICTNAEIPSIGVKITRLLAGDGAAEAPFHAESAIDQTEDGVANRKGLPGQGHCRPQDVQLCCLDARQGSE